MSPETDLRESFDAIESQEIADHLHRVIFLLSIWALVIEPRLIDEVRHEVQIPHLPQAWEKAQIAFISDLQLGMWLGNEDTAKRVIERIISERPAVVLIWGDFIYHPTEDDDPLLIRDQGRQDISARLLRKGSFYSLSSVMMQIVWDRMTCPPLPYIPTASVPGSSGKNTIGNRGLPALSPFAAGESAWIGVFFRRN